MNIIAADDERIALQLLITSIHEAVPAAHVHGFSSSEDALAFGSVNPCEVAFLDVDMSDVDGITLAKYLKQVNPKINSILANHKIWIQCFGNFEVFADGEPIKFTYSKTKELLAFLVDRKGAFCSNGEIIAALWEDNGNSVKKSSYLRDLKADLLATFNAYNVGNSIRKQRGVMAVSLDKIACDYYNWIQGDIQAINAYRGEYMSQYSWGEFTLGSIEMTATTHLQ